MDSSGELLNDFRRQVTDYSQLKRATLALVLNAGDGLLLGELLRQIKEETVYALVDSAKEQQMLAALFKKPASGIEANILVSSAGNPKSFEIDEIRFERIIGRNVLQKHVDKTALLETLKAWLSENGFLVFGETVPALGQRLTDLIPLEMLEPEFRKVLKTAEDEIYHDSDNSRSNWTPSTLRDELEAANWKILRWQVKEFSIPTMIRTAQIEQWFPTQANGLHSSYKQRLSAYFSQEQINALREIFRSQVVGKIVNWRSVSLFMQLKP